MTCLLGNDPSLPLQNAPLHFLPSLFALPSMIPFLSPITLFNSFVFSNHITNIISLHAFFLYSCSPQVSPHWWEKDDSHFISFPSFLSLSFSPFLSLSLSFPLVSLLRFSFSEMSTAFYSETFSSSPLSLHCLGTLKHTPLPDSACNQSYHIITQHGNHQ
eukprot:TRINITY_DN34_c0_g1_i10.p1 TRINITY_DN34_c0_g1~~TRINITY_DN34_c0_g1_i10.p1  ORF type:complete len:160 (+),score=2.25 TRINITY_DN34_c0_g1_i10:1726-2205(+)